MKNITRYIVAQVQRRIFIAFLFAVFTVILFVRLISVYNTDTANKDFMVKHTYEIIKYVESIRSSAAESDAAEKGYLLTGDSAWKITLSDAQIRMVKALNDALSLVKDANQKINLKQIEQEIHQKIVIQNANVNSPRLLNEQRELKQYDDHGKIISENIQAHFDTFMVRQNELLKERSDASSDAKTKALTIAVGGLGLFFLFITATLARLNKDIRRRKIAEHKIRKSETKYRHLIEDAGVTLFTSNLEGKFTYVSGRCQSLTGYSSEELTGRSFATLIEPEWIADVAKQYQEQLMQNIPETTIEFPIITRTNERKWVEQQAVLQYNDVHHITGFQCVVKDITAKKEADISLKKSEQLMQSVLNNTREGFFMVNRSYELLLVNRQAKEGMEKISGKLVEPGMNLLDFVVEQEKEQAVENLNRVFNGELVNFESRYATPDGDQWIKISHSPVRDESGEIIGAAIVTHDVTEKRAQEERIRDSEQKIRAMLESTKEGFFMIGEDYSIKMMNEVGSEIITSLTGKKGKIGESMLDYILPSRQKVFLEIFDKVMAGGTHETEVSAISSEGEKWFRNNYFPVRNSKNEVIAICTSVKDVTEKKLVDNALSKIRVEREEYQNRLQSILDNTPLVVFVKDLEGRYLFVNKSFLELLNLTDKEVIGKTDFDITSEVMATEYKNADDEVIRTKASIEREETIYNHNGGQNLLLVKFPMFDRNKNIYGVGGIATDYTEKVQYRQKLIEAKRKAEHAEQLQEQFLANMSHEIRTPMNGIIGMTNVLMGTSLDGEQKEFVNIIKQSSDNLLFLINDILDLSKIKSGKLSMEKIEFDIRNTIDTTLAPFYLKAKEKNIQLILEQDDIIPQWLSGDPYRLNQILNNLLSNAMKFTERGTVKLSVKQMMKAKDQLAIGFAITDSGVGIEADKLNTIFNSFEQASSSTTRKYGGTGLGLAITRQLVEMQGGKMYVNSTAGEGSVFSFTIIYGFAQPQQEEVSLNRPVTTDNTALNGKRILVAEDNEINQKVILNILKKEGIETVITNNGKEAVNMLEQGEGFDLIILDLQMPEMDGFQTATYIRKKLGRNTPIIAMTASALRNEKMKCFQLGMNEYLTKPFAPEELFTQLRRFLLAQPVISKDAVKQVTSPRNEYYNLSHLHEMEDNDYFCEILQLFLDTTPTALSEIKEAVLYENWEEVYKKAHKMKSGVGILQMDKMLELVTSIEKNAKEQNEIETISTQLKQVTELFGLIKPMLEAELKSARLVNV